MNKHYRTRLRLSLADQKLLREIFNSVLPQYEEEDAARVSSLFTKIVSKA